jgi:hypothetical protein
MAPIRKRLGSILEKDEMDSGTNYKVYGPKSKKQEVKRKDQKANYQEQRPRIRQAISQLHHSPFRPSRTTSPNPSFAGGE